MTLNQDEQLRLAFLIRVIKKEQQHLLQTDARLFATPLTKEKLAELEQNIGLAEQLDAFASRFGRLQDNVGDKLLPAVLLALGEKKGPVLDNLNKAEKFGWLSSSGDWIAARQLRNKMVHEYIEDPEILAASFNVAHQFIQLLQNFSQQLIEAVESRGLAIPEDKK
ncbi:MAG: hypothetical protein KJ556_02430 [Gammaproteobacteria bacterium]|nr:hypothetical protein [Gammaproteobacteria bacterium]MBU2056624.1 hypothetical protein [Gammaproteobacteria bacterium]MBU2173961.1 hypothetical protein [Gammaproteobacteria bacterium]MBU2247267.1 hypothetical protein [Gammaproteobacteria bacterium]MBU2344925.1 hypothetical protein [Gammaproteobacteria bacterium]